MLTSPELRRVGHSTHQHPRRCMPSGGDVVLIREAAEETCVGSNGTADAGQCRYRYRCFERVQPLRCERQVPHCTSMQVCSSLGDGNESAEWPSKGN